MRSLPLSVVAVLALAACDGTAPGTSPMRVPLNRLKAGAVPYEWFSTIGTPEQGAVRDQARWDSLYVRIEGNVVPAPTAGPTLAFGDSTIVYVAIGSYPDPRNAVVLDSAVVYGGTLYVHYTDLYRDGCGVAAVEVRPVDVAQIPRWTGPITFLRHGRMTTCP